MIMRHLRILFCAFSLWGGGLEQASANFLMSPSGSTTAFAIDGSNQGTSLCAAASTECPASVPINTAGAPLFVTGNAGLVTGAGGTFPVTGTFWQTTQPVSAASLPLPTGASTSALQSTGNTSLASILTALGSPFQAGGSIGNTTFASTQSGTWNVGPATATAWGVIADKGTFTASTSPANLVAGEFTTSGATACASGQSCAVGMTAARGLFTDIESVAGTALGVPVAWGSTPSGNVFSANVNCVVGCSAAGTTFAQGGATAPTNASLAGGTYNSSAPTLTTGQSVALQTDVNGNLKVVGTGVAQGSTTSGQTGSPVMGAVTTGVPSYTTAQSNLLSLNTAGQLRTVNPSYPDGATPITATATGTTAATTATLAANASLKTYLCWFSIRANATAAATANSTVTGTVTGTLNFTQWTAPNASGIGLTEMIFNPCIPSSAANTAIAVISAAPGTGGVVSVSAGGYQGT